MKNTDGREYLQLVWKSPESRKQHVIGELSKNGKFCFKYCGSIKEAIDEGFIPIIAFSDINRVYENDTMFPVFSSRLPSANRVDIDQILQKYEMKDYDEFELLRRSGSKLPTDNLEFIDPIFYESLEYYKNSHIERIFQVAGSRYYVNCNNEDCIIKEGKGVELIPEPDNKFDSNAIKVIYNVMHIGYVPRCYSKALTEIINSGYNYDCYINSIKKDKNDNYCIKLKVIIKL